MGHLERKGHATRFENVARRIRIFSDWYKTVVPFNRIFVGEQRLHLRNGFSVVVREIRSMDLNAVMDVLGDNEYHLENYSLPEHATVIDLGANIGTFSMIAKREFPTANIFAYEPYPSTFKILTENAPKGVTLFEVAAAGKSGTVHFALGSDYLGMKVSKEGEIEVRSLSLDEIIVPHGRVDLLKIDIEGSEYDVLNHTSAETFKKIDRIIMETHSRPDFNDQKWADELLGGRGFSTVWIAPGIVEAQRL